MTEIKLNIREEDLLKVIEILSYNGYDDVKITKYSTLKNATYEPMYHVRAKQSVSTSED